MGCEVRNEGLRRAARRRRRLAVAGQNRDTRWDLEDGGSKVVAGLGPEAQGRGRRGVWVYPGRREDGRVIADVVRLGKGHTEDLEPKVTEALIALLVSAPGGKAKAAAKTKVSA